MYRREIAVASLAKKEERQRANALPRWEIRAFLDWVVSAGSLVWMDKSLVEEHLVYKC
jgi:hypothetical protein